MASTANLLPEVLVSLFESFEKGNLEKAAEKQEALQELRKVMKYASTPAVLKRAMTLSGVDVGSARFPVEACDEKVEEEVRKMLKGYGKL